MFVKILSESGFDEVLFGLGLKYGLTCGKEIDILNTDETLRKRLYDVAKKTAHAKYGENDFLNQIQVVLDVDAPMYWWEQADKFLVNYFSQGESTILELMINEITQQHFENALFPETIKHLEGLRKDGAYKQLISELPQCWLQRRIISCSYATLQNIYIQRKKFKFAEWNTFISAFLSGLKYPELINQEIQ